MRLFVGVSCTLSASMVLFAACLPHPAGDYDEFVEKTESMRGLGRDGGGIEVEASVPEEATQGTYLAVCLPNLVSGRVDRALRFFAETEFTPTEGGGGTLKLVLNPLSVSATTFERSSIGSSPLVVGDALPISSDASFSGGIAEAAIAGSANPISGSDITIVNITLGGKFSATGDFCSDFVGRVTKPIQNDFSADCTYFNLEEGTEFSVTTPSQAEPATFLVIGDKRYGRADFGCK